MRYQLYALMVLATGMMTSCEKVINVKLNDAEKKYVIEGTLSDQAQSAKVQITWTKSFDDDNTFPGVSGAQVSITDGTGPEQPLIETSPGVYQNSGITGLTGHTYRLKVMVNGETFTANSTIPVKVLFDTFYIKEDLIFDDIVKLVNLEYQDPSGKGNYYRFVQYVNGIKDKTLFVRDDNLNDGRYLTTQLFTTNDDDDDDEGASKIKTGDKVKVEMMCTDAAVYKYFYSLDQSATGTNQSASPANPVTNITGGALGYFSAHTYQTDSLTSP